MSFVPEGMLLLPPGETAGDVRVKDSVHHRWRAGDRHMFDENILKVSCVYSLAFASEPYALHLAPEA